MAKATKKIVKKSARKTVLAPVELSQVEPATSVVTPKPRSNRFLTLALLALGVALLVYKFGPWLAPAIVDNRPLTRFALWSRLEQNYGAQTLDDMVNERILNNAIARSGVKVEQAKIDEQLKSLESQFAANGGLDEALKQRGLTKSDLEQQVRTQLSVETLLADKIAPTEEEVRKQFDDNVKTLYKDKKFEDVQASITDELKQTKLRDAFLDWFADVKKDAKVKTFGI